MKLKLVDVLRCPACRSRLQLHNEVMSEDEVKTGELVCGDNGHTYLVHNFIPRFVNDDNYAKGFGYQWNIHARTQVDKFNGTSISSDRFYDGTQWNKALLAGQVILEAGCGAGRFTQIMLDAGLEVFSLDYSNAVDACLDNHGLHPNLHLIQGNIYELPFEDAIFDRVFCFGVLQHTPDVRKSFGCLTAKLKPGGEIAIDLYPNTIKARMHYPRYVLRPLAKRLPNHILYKIVEASVRVLLPLSIALKAIPFVGRYVYPLVPVANYWRELPLDKAMLYDWSVIDTFDWLASWYDQPQKAATIERWFAEENLVNVQVRRAGSYIGTGQKC